MDEEYWDDPDGEEGEESEIYSDKDSSSGEDVSRILTRPEAGACLHTLGKCDTGLGYAYLGLNASNKGLTNVSVIPSFKHVIYVNVSGNRLTNEALQVLSRMTYLLMLQADRNLITSAELTEMPYLQVLSLNRNRLTETRGISHKLLERLELNHNKIKKVDLDCKNLKNLRILELRGNMLTSLNGINFPNLTRLYLAENKIGDLHGLHLLTNLEIIHLRNNCISNLNGFGQENIKLSYLNIRGNEVSRLSELEKLKSLSELETLVILGNPALVDKEDAYRKIVLTMLPNLRRIDKDTVLHEERKEAEEFLEQMRQEGITVANLDYNLEFLDE